ncbi:hypothetical protein K227x_39740 [Rubripirellula lacrimiformis]|uniref:Phosphatase n=2 Tax=Rubripirellula lacrimiformis TaxID=1930273 RepID=A0A517NEM4_9BACT|nr:hypothetical protein K227x_39740 [Rubripirellula lacrimiformis]
MRRCGSAADGQSLAAFLSRSATGACLANQWRRGAGLDRRDGRWGGPKVPRDVHQSVPLLVSHDQAIGGYDDGRSAPSARPAETDAGNFSQNIDILQNRSMPQTVPFAALRYNLEHIGSLSDVVAPPYDVIDPELQEQLYKRHTANVVRVILNRTEPGDAPDANYDRAAKFVRQWISEGVLMREESPAFYVYHQTFEVDGQTVTRRGFQGRVRTTPFGEGNIYPHEETHPKAKVDRLKLTTATKQNNSQIFGLYPDPENQVIDLLDAATEGIQPVQATDHLGVLHTLWPVTDPQVIQQVSDLMMDRPMFVADGHHRYETSCNYKDQVAAQYAAEQGGPLPEDHPANFLMTMMVGMSDPGMVVLPTHRLLRGTPRFSSAEITAALAGVFDCELVAGGLQVAGTVWGQMETSNDQGLIGLYAVKDDSWLLCRATDQAAVRMAQIEPDKSDDWRSLGVSLLHRLVIDELLESAGHPKPTYVHEVDEVIGGMQGQGSQAESDGDDPYTLAALVMPATLAHVEAISLHKERMPAKSTYFYPKLLSGLTFNPLQ